MLTRPARGRRRFAPATILLCALLAQHVTPAATLSPAQGVTVVSESKIAAAVGVSGDYFGEAVALDGDTLLVGARYDSAAGFGSGAAYVFTREAAGWTRQQRLVAPDAAE